jgi:hypothetical protein
MLQGSGWLGHTFIAYGRGNLLWWERSYSTATGVLDLTIHPHAPLTARFIPAVVSGTGQPIADRGPAAPPRATPACAPVPSWHRGQPDRPGTLRGQARDAASRNGPSPAVTPSGGQELPRPGE